MRIFFLVLIFTLLLIVLPHSVSAQLPTRAFSVCSTEGISACITEEKKKEYFDSIFAEIQAMQTRGNQSGNNCPINDPSKIQQGLENNNFFNNCWSDPYGNGVGAKYKYFEMVKKSCSCNLGSETELLYQDDFYTRLRNSLNITGTPPVVPTVEAGSIPTPTTEYPEPSELFGLTDVEVKTWGDTCGIASSDEVEKTRCCMYSAQYIEWSLPFPFEPVAGVFRGTANILIGMWNQFTRYLTTSSYAFSEAVGDAKRQNPYCYEGEPSVDNPYENPDDCYCRNPDQSGLTDEKIIANFCGGLPEGEMGPCQNCFKGIRIEDGKEVVGKAGVWTAMGCIQTNLQTFITENIFSTAIGIAGAIALLCIIYSAFLMQVSQGNPEQIQKAQEMLTSCITGLIMIIFSVLILRFIGVDLLRIPGFSNTSEGAKDDSEIITKVSLANPTPIITPGTTAALVTTLPPSPTITRTPITALTNFPTPQVTSANTLTPILSPFPSYTPVPSPTLARNPALGEFDCDTNGPLANEVYLYDDLDHKGYCLRLYVAGFHNLNTINNALVNFLRPWSFAKCDNWNYEDCISSIKVGSAVKVTLYNDRFYRGDSITLISGDYPNLGLNPTSNNNTVIDRISSVLVENQ